MSLALTQAHASAADWETVTSKEGQFTVALPGKPTVNKTRTEKGTGGDMKTVILGYEGEGGYYLAYRCIVPTAIVKGAENAELDAERDSMAKEWNGKVMAERKIRAGEKVGRDFTIRGIPSKGKGILTIRMREYLSGNSVYIVAVISLPNRQLPEDTGRFLGSLAIDGVCAGRHPHAGAEGHRNRRLGLALDPQKDAEFVADKKSLRVNVTGSRHQMAVENAILNAPRVMREVEGDFVMTVKVGGDFQPGGKSTNPKSIPFNGAGIIVFSDTDNFIRVERAAFSRGGKVSPYVNFEEFEGGTRGANDSEPLKGGDCWVRMERKGSRLQCSISFDGKAWKDLTPIQTVWPTKLKIGLIATSSSGLPFSVTFEEFELKGTAK